MQQCEPPPPPEPDPARIVPPDSLLEACRLGVAAELENAAMYDRLLAATEQADVRMVLERLQAASRDRHLPAFRRCVERGGATAAGRGGGGRGKGAGTGGGRGQGRGRRGLGRGGHGGMDACGTESSEASGAFSLPHLHGGDSRAQGG